MQKNIINTEIKYKNVRSSGAGGQHVNKVSSKVILMFNIDESAGLSLEEKLLIRTNLSSKLTDIGILLLQCDETRSQFRNKKIVTDRLFSMLETALHKHKPRKKTKPSRAAILKAKMDKKKASLKKNLRRKPPID